MNKIAVVGTGYVGLVQGVMLADFGMQVVCMDVDSAKIEKLKAGIVPIYEPGLKEMMDKNTAQGRLRFSTDMEECVSSSDVIFIAVGTPPMDDGSADLTYVYEVAKKIGAYINGYKVIVDKSTVPVGTGRNVERIVREEMGKRSVSYEFDVVSNPEFLREGKALKDSQHPDRVVIGADSQRAIEIMKQVYDVLYINQTPFIITNIETAELIKYASNSFLAVKISFINEMALLAEKVGADVNTVAKAMGMDGRISPKFLHAGPGFGGSCFPKDTKAIVEIAKENQEEFMVVEAAIRANEKQKKKMAHKVIDALDREMGASGATVAVWGLSFKPETDDMRAAPSIDIIREMVGSGIRIRAYCPQGMTEAKWRLSDVKDSITYCESEYEAVTGADALVVMTEWNQFRGADLDRVKQKMKNYHLFDLRNIYKKHIAQQKGFCYYGVGR